MKILLDTNEYEKIVLDKDGPTIMALIYQKQIDIIDFTPIKEELRNTPKDKRLNNGRKARSALTGVYHSIVTGKTIGDKGPIENLAREYHKEYTKNGGGASWSALANDFKIVACASLKMCNIIVSDDSRTLKSTAAMRAYYIVNDRKRKLRMPEFYDFEDFKNYLIN